MLDHNKSYVAYGRNGYHYFNHDEYRMDRAFQEGPKCNLVNTFERFSGPSTTLSTKVSRQSRLVHYES